MRRELLSIAALSLLAAAGCQSSASPTSVVADANTPAANPPTPPLTAGCPTNISTKDRYKYPACRVAP
jgi:hypothetical protein